MVTFGARLLAERQRLGLNQADFGALGGLQRNAQGKYESGEKFPDALYLAGLAAAGVDLHFLFYGVYRDKANAPAALALEQAVHALPPAQQIVALMVVRLLDKTNSADAATPEGAQDWLRAANLFEQFLVAGPVGKAAMEQAAVAAKHDRPPLP
jgi:transcriptional regulator with XRE-family HTH domain